MSNQTHLEWDTFTGKAKRVWRVKAACKAHFNSYTDEYGGWVFCNECNGKGYVSVRRWERAPEYDAPAEPRQLTVDDIYGI